MLIKKMIFFIFLYIIIKILGEKIMDFKVTFEGFTLISKRKPREYDPCILVWKNSKGKFDISVGVYNKQEKSFYVNYGYGGLILDLDVVVAWKRLDQFKVETIQEND